MRSSSTMNWPEVWDEDKTLDAILEGASIARFGDGEFNLMVGGKCKTQDHSPTIEASLRRIVSKQLNCLIGIPRIEYGPKKNFWHKFYRRDICSFLRSVEYASAFITRPDSAPWIDRSDYWRKVAEIWSGKNVTLVRGSEKSLTAELLWEAKRVNEIIFPKRNAFEYYKATHIAIDSSDVVLLCCGPTATIMAYDLALCGIQAIDLGHIGMFLRKHLNGEPMVVTEKDKAVDREVA